MIDRPTYLFFIFDENNAPLYLDDAGHIQAGDPTTLKKPDGNLASLEQSPKGWQGLLLKYARNMSWGALFREMIVELEFPGDGASILRDSMWNKRGVETVRNLGIMKLNRLSLPYEYTSWSLTELNFAKYNQQKDYVKIEALEGGLSKLLKANQEIKYQIPLDTSKSFHVERDGLILTETANFEIPAGVQLAYNSFGHNPWLPVAFMNKEGQSSGMAWFSQNIGQKLDDPLFPITSTNYLGKSGPNLNPDPAQIEIFGKIIYKVITDGDGGIAFRMRFQTSSQDFGNQDDYNLGAGAALDTPGEVITTNVNITIPLNPAESLYLGGIFFGAGPPDNAVIEFMPGSKLSFRFTNRGVTSYSKEMYGIDLFKELVNKMTDGKYQGQSAYLTSRKDISFTSGQSIRNNGRQAQDYIETTLKDFFQDSRFNGTALTIWEDKILLEKIETFFTNDVVVDLGIIGDVEVYPAEDLMFNTIRTGWRKQEYDNVNGKYEWNQGQDWNCPITKIVSKLVLESNYRTDPIGTELYRLETLGLDTTDRNEDKDVFKSNIKTLSRTITQIVDFDAFSVSMTNPGEFPFNPGSIIRITGSGAGNNVDVMVVAQGVNIVQFDPAGAAITDELGANVTITFLTGGIFQFNRPAFTSLTGIPTEMIPSIYNVLFSPKLALLNNGAQIHGCLDLQDDKEIKFGTADQNALLSYVLAGVTLTQNQNIQIGALPTKLWKPYYTKFNTKIPVDVIELIDTNPFGKVQFTSNGTVFRGFLFDGGVNPDTLDEQEWILLNTIENDMKKYKVNAR